jgi:hypothetical protein
MCKTAGGETPARLPVYGMKLLRTELHFHVHIAKGSTDIRHGVCMIPGGLTVQRCPACTGQLQYPVDPSRYEHCFAPHT